MEDIEVGNIHLFCHYMGRELDVAVRKIDGKYQIAYQVVRNSPLAMADEPVLVTVEVTETFATREEVHAAAFENMRSAIDQGRA
ncbi:hypothetical protein [Burkholderia pseudomallei]|uniref:hypothetical protein n=1 Tax=Burkholderia pseudomallei TaxID=28450 RepID=UPI000538C6C4|nr:hypothetical protein [Burkholderia pseudomallei]KGV23343.1 hypothetical protein X894_2695 [Burkholderia pseudomallei MSHR4462]KGX02062.1 hypothetical protein Y601_1908 [Burkholderia pseudomallei MSHR640]ONC65364.1 hypothetical protein AQ919_28435 [Burkholderia pseudomallei]ONC76404.1 hypothetical protein AQ921_03060 [Burkholderia pseudomallei]